MRQVKEREKNHEGALLDLKGGLKIQHLWTLLPFMCLNRGHLRHPAPPARFLVAPQDGRGDCRNLVATPDRYFFLHFQWRAVSSAELAGRDLLLYPLLARWSPAHRVRERCAAGTGLLSVYSLCFRELRGPRVCALGSVILIVPLVIFSNVRPQVFSILLFAFSYQLLSEFR